MARSPIFRFLRRFGITDPRWPAMTPDLADYLEERDREIEDYLSQSDRVGWWVQRIATQSIATATSTLISWDTEQQDTDGFIAVTATTVTIPAGLGGVYAITVGAYAAAGVGATNSLDLNTTVTGAASPFTAFNIATTTVVEPLAAGQTVEARVYHSAGVNVNFQANFFGYRISL